MGGAGRVRSGSGQRDVTFPLRLVGLRTARREAASLLRTVVVERAGLSAATVSSDGALAVSLLGDMLLLVRSCCVSGKAVPTTFTVEGSGGGDAVELVSAATLPDNMLEPA